MVPTVLDAIGVEPHPRRSAECRSRPLEGVSFVHTFDAPDAPTRHTHPVLRDVRPSLDRPRRLAGGVPVAGPQLRRVGRAGPQARRHDHACGARPAGRATAGSSTTSSTTPPSPTTSRRTIPTGCASSSTLWWSEAEKYKVLPLDGSLQPRLAASGHRPRRPRSRFVYYPNASVVPAFAAPPTYNRPYSVEADVEIPAGGAQGVLVAQGGDAGGFSLHLARRPPAATSTTTADVTSSWSSPSDPVPEGRHLPSLRVRADRCAGHPCRKGRARPRTAVRRRRAGRQHRLPAHHSAAVRAGGAQLRIRLRRSRRRRLRAPVRVHRHDPLGHVRHLR